MSAPRSVNLLLFGHDGRLLLQFRDAAARVEPLCWGLWGGRIDPVDTSDVLSAAIREANEELAIRTTSEDWTALHERSGSDGQSSTLLRYRQPVAWHDVSIREGAGAAFLRVEDLVGLTLHKRLRYYLEEHPALLRG